MIKDFTLQSEWDGLRMYGLVYEPEAEPRAVIQLVHGMCEYKERYQKTMEYFCSKGYVVACHDQRGHGQSVFSEEDSGYFGDKTGNAIVQDAVQVTKYLKAEYPSLPLIVFGHSMGSMIARCMLQGNEELIDKLVICGTPNDNALVEIAIALTKTIALFRGKKHRSRMLAELSVGNGDKRFPGEGRGAWLSSNRENIAEYFANPKSSFIFTCNGFENLFRLMRRAYNKKKYAVTKPDLPVHFVSGGDDPVMGNEIKWFKAVEALRAVGYTNVTGKLYQGLRHEILNEKDNEEVLLDLLAFFEA